jgi:acetyl-CoA synthetase
MPGDRLEAYHFYEEDWNDYDQLRESFEWEVPDPFNAGRYLCDRWADDPDRVAIYGATPDGPGETITYEELAGRTNRLANYLADRGVERGDRVGVNAPQRPETVVAHLACWKLGAVSVPLSTLFGPDAIEYRLDDAGAVAAVVDGSNVADFREANVSLALDTVLTVSDVEPADGERAFDEALADASPEFEIPETDPEDDLILIYTSGTTGDPKGVRHVHRIVLGHLPLFLTTFCNVELRDEDVFWTPAEWAWIASLFDVVVPGLYYGKPVVGYNSAEFDPDEAFEVIETYEVTNFFAPPTALRMMMQTDADPYDTDTIRSVASGGESLGQDVVEWADEVFGDGERTDASRTSSERRSDGPCVHEGYGQTEANMIVGDCTALAEFREGKMGLAGPGHEVTVVDPDTAEPTVDPGDVGEIAVRYEGNPVCFVEYWNEPEKTDRKVRNGWLLTEDLGRMDEDGYFQFESRKDDVIISAGYRIGPVEVEESLAGHGAVADAAVIGVPDDERGEVPKAFVVLAPGHEGDEELRTDLRQHVRDRLAKYEYPREIEFVDELPKTTTGKVRRASLREREGLQ